MAVKSEYFTEVKKMKQRFFFLLTMAVIVFAAVGARADEAIMTRFSNAKDPRPALAEGNYRLIGKSIHICLPRSPILTKGTEYSVKSFGPATECSKGVPYSGSKTALAFRDPETGISYPGGYAIHTVDSMGESWYAVFVTDFENAKPIAEQDESPAADTSDQTKKAPPAAPVEKKPVAPKPNPVADKAPAEKTRTISDQQLQDSKPGSPPANVSSYTRSCTSDEVTMAQKAAKKLPQGTKKLTLDLADRSSMIFWTEDSQCTVYTDNPKESKTEPAPQPAPETKAPAEKEVSKVPNPTGPIPTVSTVDVTTKPEVVKINMVVVADENNPVVRMGMLNIAFSENNPDKKLIADVKAAKDGKVVVYITDNHASPKVFSDADIAANTSILTDAKFVYTLDEVKSFLLDREAKKAAESGALDVRVRIVIPKDDQPLNVGIVDTDESETVVRLTGINLCDSSENCKPTIQVQSGKIKWPAVSLSDVKEVLYNSKPDAAMKATMDQWLTGHGVRFAPPLKKKHSAKECDKRDGAYCF